MLVPLESTTFDPGVLIQMIVSFPEKCPGPKRSAHTCQAMPEIMRVGHPKLLGLTRNMFSKMPETFRLRNYRNLHRKVGYADYIVTQLGKIVEF